MPGSRSSQRPCGLGDVLRPGPEDVEDEVPARLEQPVNGAHDRAAVVVGLHVQQRAERDDHERHRPLDRRVAEVAVAQIDRDAGESGPLAGDLEHPLGEIDADHLDPLGRDRDGDPARADAELDHRAARFPRALQVERDVLDDAHRPGVVEPGDAVVGGHGRYAARHGDAGTAVPVYLAPVRDRGRGARRVASAFSGRG